MNALCLGLFFYLVLSPLLLARLVDHLTGAGPKISIFQMTMRFSQRPPSPFSALNACGKGITFPRASIGPQPGRRVGGDRDMAKI